VTRSVYVTGIDRGDGRQVVDLGVMELLTRQVDRVGVFRPLVHDGPDRLFELLRSRYRLTQDPATVYGLDYQEASTLQAEQGTDDLVAALVDRFHLVTRDYDVVLVLGTDYAGTQLPDELSLNARLANEFGASVIPVVGGRGQSAESVLAETRNAFRAYDTLGCDVLAMITNRVAREDRDTIAERLTDRLPVPCHVLPDEPALSAPTVAQIAHTLGAKVLLGDDSGLSRDTLDFVFGGAMLPNFLSALTPGCLVVTPGDRADVVLFCIASFRE
jgi:phosphate acetyltransferase